MIIMMTSERDTLTREFLSYDGEFVVVVDVDVDDE